MIDIHINETLETEVGLGDIDILLDQTFDLGPMMLLKLVVSKGCYNRHSVLELVDEDFKLLLNWIWVKVLFKTHAVLGEFLGKCGNVFGINLTELGFQPFLVEVLPLVK